MSGQSSPQVGLPLAGVRIIALEQFGAGPFATSHLADLGAEIIKIEPPATGGDVGRHVPPGAVDGDSLFFEAFNRSKRSVFLDIEHAEGRAIFEKMVAGADAVFYNLRGDVADRLRLRFADLRAVNPRVVVCSLSGFGLTGPRRQDPGYDYVMQAMAGWMHITGDPAGPPAKSGLSVVDYSSGYAAALALVTGLFAAARTGVGSECDISLFDTAIHMLTYEGVWTLNSDYAAQRRAYSAHPSIVPFQAFECSDGWLTVAAAKEKFWRRLAVALEREDLLEDSRFGSMSLRAQHREQLVPILAEIFLGDRVEVWTERLRSAGVPVGPVHDMRTALQDPQVAARDLIQTADHPRYGTIKTIASPVRVGEGRRAPMVAPRPDADTDAVLGELGIDASAIADLRKAGIAGAR